MPVEFTLPVSVFRDAERIESVYQGVSGPALAAITERALIRGADILHEQMQLHVSGPRPRRLDAVTGELRAGFEADATDLPHSISVGTPADPFFWAVFHEVGARGRRKRPFAEPALEIAAAEMPDIFVDELEKARDNIR